MSKNHTQRCQESLEVTRVSQDKTSSTFICFMGFAVVPVARAFTAVFCRRSVGVAAALALSECAPRDAEPLGVLELAAAAFVISAILSSRSH
jgi:hypothetical protein